MRQELAAILTAAGNAATCKGVRNIAVIGAAAILGSIALGDSRAAPPLLTFDQVPEYFTRSPARFAALLLHLHSTPSRIAHFGDSTAFDNLGAGGAHMNWRRWLWHQYHGHTPGTQLSRSANFGGVPGAEWIFMGSVIEPEPPKVPDNYLPPGHQAAVNAAQSFRADTSEPIGLFLMLNHRNDNNQTMNCAASPIGFYYVAPAIAQGMPANAVGMMQGGASLIDASAGIRLEVLAVSYPFSAPTVTWYAIPQSAGGFCGSNSSDAIVQSGSLFGGAQSLTGAMGRAFRAQTPVLTAPAGLQRFFAADVTGSSADPAHSVQIIGARFISGNPRGVIIDSFSSSGYWARSMLQNHPDCGYILGAAGYTLAWIMYGLNDQGLMRSALDFEQDIRDDIVFIRAAMSDPSFPIVLETNTYRTGETSEGVHYAGALYAIAQDDPNVLLINSRRVIQQRYSWGDGSEDSYLTDGVHYTNLGGEAIARCSIETALAHLTGQPITMNFVRQPKASRGKDTAIASGTPAVDCGSCPTLAVGAASDGSNNRRALLVFDDLAKIPPNSTIQSAKLYLTVATAASAAAPMEIDRVTNPNWLEGNSDGTGASWLMASTNPPVPWTTPGGDFTAQGQIIGVTLPAPPLAAPGMQINYDITPLAQDAFVHHNGVLALLLKRVSEGSTTVVASFYSSDVTVASQRPMLIIRFTPPVIPGPPQCVADCAPLGGDGRVNIDDLLLIISHWGAGGGPADIAPPGGNGVVNIDDLLAVLMAWGTCH